MGPLPSHLHRWHGREETKESAGFVRKSATLLVRQEPESITPFCLSRDELEPFVDTIDRSIQFAAVRLAMAKDNGSAVNLQKWFARAKRTLYGAVSDLNAIHETAVIMSELETSELPEIKQMGRKFEATKKETV